MKWFSNLRISSKLIIGFIVVALIAGIVGAIGLVSLSTVGQADRQLYQENTLGLNAIGNAAVTYQRVRFNIVKAIMSGDAKTAQDCIKKINDFISQTDNNLKSYETTIFTPKDKELFDVLKSSWENYKPFIDKAIKYIQSNDLASAKSLVLGDMQTAGNSAQTAFDNLFEFNTDAGNQKAAQNASLIMSATMIMTAVVAVAVIIAIILGVIISRIISNPVKQLVTAADKLALGDIDIDINIHTKDEVGSLAESFQKLITSTKEQAQIAERIADGDLSVDLQIRSEKDLLGKSFVDLINKLNQVIETIVTAADQVASGSTMVSTSSMALSQGATEQASSIEELTASLEEISSQTIHNAENASKASDLTKNAETNAAEGNMQMKDMLSAMTEINESSSSINRIIKVIDDIAFQTNILALNAAVEAARAGQHGKGFAVVAEEVRNLAARSAGAAKETTDLIESSIKKVEAGTKIANTTASALSQIVDEVKKAAVLVNDIATASSQQSSGVEQINQGIAQISQVVQTNAATSEESAAASEELSSQAAQLKEIVSVFKLKHDITIRKAVESTSTLSVPKAKIALSDNNFGKY